jgi:hypothetical protein
LKTGKAVFSPDVSIKTYEVAEEDGEVVFYLDEQAETVTRKPFSCMLSS